LLTPIIAQNQVTKLGIKFSVVF